MITKGLTKEEILDRIPVEWTTPTDICKIAGFYWHNSKNPNQNYIYPVLRILIAEGKIERRRKPDSHPRYTEYRKVPDENIGKRLFENSL